MPGTVLNPGVTKQLRKGPFPQKTHNQEQINNHRVLGTKIEQKFRIRFFFYKISTGYTTSIMSRKTIARGHLSSE